MPDHIDHNSKQVAVLVIFNEGVTVQQAFLEIAKLQQVDTTTVKEFNPDYGGVCIYQP